MFEYLMPGLVLQEPRGSVLFEACQVALQEQMAFARAQGLPWGVSRVGLCRQRRQPGLSIRPAGGAAAGVLRRTPNDEWVIAPYATALAAPLAPLMATQNFRTLESLGARGCYGFIEVLDYTTARRTSDEAFVPVATFMAHHQGMSIVVLANVLS